MTLELQKLSVGYGDRSVLRDVSLSFSPGMIHTIIGKNGSGKSTLLKACCGLLPAQSGSILLNGRALSQYPGQLRAQNISYLAQNISTPGITAERLLAHARFPHLGYPKKLRREDREIIHRSLARLRAEEFASVSLRDMSGGERQRVYLAMQLAQETPVLLLDEPTTYLDIEYQILLMQLLQELKAEGKTIIMVLHDLEQALTHSNRLVALELNGAVHTGSPEEFLERGILKQVFHVDVQRSGIRFE